ncbi:hypothetical protein AM2_089 [Lactococcus phage AM2]|uniref:Uncharacterized protein n=7 Tax=Audreyjarvisvirus AM1 TaxID=2845188 RepID=A0A1W6JLM4_9CAUD|nr:hypothetical protein H1Z30_gp090 [Lactococcus phage AM1]ARM66394.1 hypothetical protein AM2_089 [Lactococcus phage AM2]ARM66571.1 hypothetical protein AM3_089 [Lactococcus phage AM3]ARM67124.1 hypothetical protein AM8_089 [Lactococcus phage AM8]ARM67303.1 hypothetical protein AM9_090 [Lactococcus phage AM9]ARM67481.1 hypothetical protein AM11_089 [Lactococcus phage AM11]ARQ95669.1 hypothetical protein AM12_090 [Lactococcus phage AM12]
MDTTTALKITVTAVVAYIFEYGWYKSVEWISEWNYTGGMIWLLATFAIQLFLVLRFTGDFLDLF